MAGGYENEDVQAELEELRRKKEAELRAWMEEERRERERRKLEREARDGDVTPP
ncbi:MAG: hypothetical protein QOD77_908 [Thermoplasmata archaeon]|jgi:hypothetical protein|nr:hypothetical protein [Thermoplasmata archaeon]